MSAIRPVPPTDPIQYNPAAVFAAGLSQKSLEALTEKLTQARRESLDDLERLWRGDTGCEEPLAPAFIDLPDRMLFDYGSTRPQSDLFAMLTTARRIREAVDRVVVLGCSDFSLSSRALFEACCHPFHNELPRGERGGRPRLSFAGFHGDNDSVQGLLDVVSTCGISGDDLLNRWAMLVVSQTDCSLETAAVTRLFLQALSQSVGGDQKRLAEVFVAITGKTDWLAELAQAIGCTLTQDMPVGVGRQFSAFTAAGILPAAIVGIDVVRLLEGAAAMNRRFREAPAADNPVLQYVGVSHLAECEMGITRRLLSSQSNRLEAICLWYEQLLWKSLGKAGGRAMPFPMLHVHCHTQSHQLGCNTLTTHILSGEPRRDRIRLPPLGSFAHNADRLDACIGRTLADTIAAAEANEPSALAKPPTADILLPRIDEHAVGQLLQMLMLATVVEGRFIGTNPYQEAARKEMASRLS